MPSVKTISFGTGNGDLEAQQMELQRRQAMIDALRRNASTPQETQIVSGRAIPQGKLGMFSQLAQIAASAYGQKKVDEKQADIGAQKRERMAAVLAKMNPNSEQATLGATPQASMAGDAPADPEMNRRWEQATAAYEFNPTLGADLMKNILTQTDEQKNMRAQGIDPQKMGAAKFAEALKKGRTEATPGTTIYDGDMKPMVTAPDFKSGFAGGFGPNGQPTMAAIPGSEVIAQQAGQVKAAEAGAQAGFDMVTVNTPQGPQMMTRQQAAAMAGGQPQQAPAAQQQGAQGFPAGTQMPAPTPGVQPRSEILQQEMAAIMARPDSDPRKAGDLAAIRREIGPGQQTTPGIKLQTDAQREAETSAVRTAYAVEQARLLAAQAPEELAKIKGAKTTVELLKMAEPLLDIATGSTVGSLRDKAGNMVGHSSKSSQAAAQLAVIGAGLTSRIEKQPGPTSDKDMALYKEAAGNLGDPTIPAGQKREAAKTIMRINQAILDDAQGGTAAKTVSANKDSGAVRKYNPATGRIE